MYSIFKNIHLITVVTTFFLFNYRVYLLLQNPLKPRAKWLKIAPHVNDSLLLISAIAMLVLSGIYPGVENSWLIIKIIMMILYIISGELTLRYATTQSARIFFAIVSLFIYLFIIYTAYTKLSIPFL